MDIFVSYIDGDDDWASWLIERLHLGGHLCALQHPATPIDEDPFLNVERAASRGLDVVIIASVPMLDAIPETRTGVDTSGSRVLVAAIEPVALPEWLGELPHVDLAPVVSDFEAARDLIIGLVASDLEDDPGDEVDLRPEAETGPATDPGSAAPSLLPRGSLGLIEPDHDPASKGDADAHQRPTDWSARPWRRAQLGQDPSPSSRLDRREEPSVDEDVDDESTGTSAPRHPSRTSSPQAGTSATAAMAASPEPDVTESSQRPEETDGELSAEVIDLHTREPIAPEPRSLDSVHHIPVSRTPYFTGRQDLLDFLAGANERQTVSLARPAEAPIKPKAVSNRGPSIVALGGVAGSGKTSIAAEVAHAAAESSAIVWWLRGDIDSCRDDLAALADRVDRSVASLAPFLASPDAPEWLLVVDDVRDPTAILGQLPDAGDGRIILTLAEDAARPPPAVELRTVVPFDADAATSFLLLRTGGVDAVGAARLADQLYGDPVALELAARHAVALDLDLGEMAIMLENAPRELDAVTKVARVSAATFTKRFLDLASLVSTISAFDTATAAALFDQVEGAAEGIIVLGELGWFDGHLHQRARRSLDDQVDGAGVAAFLDHLAEHGRTDSTTPLAHADAIERALDAIGSEVGDRTATELRGRVRSWRNEEAREVADDEPERTFDSTPPPSIEELRARLSASIDENGVDHDETNRLRLALADELIDRGDAPGGLELQETILESCERSLGPDSIVSLAARTNLAANYNVLGRHDDAATTAGIAVARLDEAMGHAHPDTIAARLVLAEARLGLGENDGAIADLQDAIAAAETGPGPLSPTSLDARAALARGLTTASRAGEAVLLFAGLLGDFERQFGPGSSSVLELVEDAAAARAAAGDLVGSIELRARLVDQHRTLVGPDDPQTIAALHALANTYASAGQHDAAIKAHRDVVADSARVFGATSPDGFTARQDLAASLIDGARYTEAADVLSTLLEDLVASGADKSPRTLQIKSSLANCLAGLGDLDAAVTLQEQTVEDHLVVHGEDHTLTLTARHNLANTYADSGRHEKALDLRNAVLADRERVLGPDHPQTLSSRNNLANSYADSGRHEKALDLRNAVLADRERVLGPDHPQTLGARNNLANSYAALGDHRRAKELRAAVLADRERTLGPDHPHTLTARNNLANSYAALGDHEEARALRERALADCERVLGTEHPHTVTARANLDASIAALGGED